MVDGRRSHLPSQDHPRVFGRECLNDILFQQRHLITALLEIAEDDRLARSRDLQAKGVAHVTAMRASKLSGHMQWGASETLADAIIDAKVTNKTHREQLNRDKLNQNGCSRRPLRASEKSKNASRSYQ